MNEKKYHTKIAKGATSQDALWRDRIDPKKDCVRCGGPLAAQIVSGGVVMKCAARCRGRAK